MLKILVPVDDSEHALPAVRHAADMYKDHHVSEVVLLNVQPPLEQGRACGYRSLDELRRLEEERGAAVLRPACDILADAGAAYVAQVRTGDLVSTISQAAAANGCDAIVMSTEGRTAIGALIAARLVAKVARMSRVPVTVVGASRPDDVAPEGGDIGLCRKTAVHGGAMPGQATTIQRLEAAAGRRAVESMGIRTAQIAAWLQPQAILFDAEIRDRRHALEVAAEAIGRAYGLDPAPVFRALWRREQTGSTALGDGFAIPHACIGGITQPTTLFIRARHAIAFDAPDGQPVSQLLAMLVPEGGARDDHLQLLALVARLFSDRRFCKQLDHARDATAAAEAFRAGIARVTSAGAAQVTKADTAAK